MEFKLKLRQRKIKRRCADCEHFLLISGVKTLMCLLLNKRVDLSMSDFCDNWSCKWSCHPDDMHVIGCVDAHCCRCEIDHEIKRNHKD